MAEPSAGVRTGNSAEAQDDGFVYLTFAAMQRQMLYASYPTFQDTGNLGAVVFLKLHVVGVCGPA